MGELKIEAVPVPGNYAFILFLILILLVIGFGLFLI